MTTRGFFISATALVICLAFSGLKPVRGASGLPDSLEFGYGAQMSLSGEQIGPAMNAAVGLGLDWIAIDFDWGELWPEAGALPDLSRLNQAMSLAVEGNLNVLLSVSNAPAWASTPTGPDPDLTASLTLSLAGLYPDALLAIELFPGANTAKGWGAPPDPHRYAQLVYRSSTVLKEAGSNIVVVAGGLTPVPSGQAMAGMDDLIFLQGLYTAGLGAYMPILSIRIEETSGSPMYVSNTGDPRFLRHYEDVRGVMLKNDHQTGKIWITGFSWPKGDLQPDDRIYTSPEEQEAWLNQAYRLLRAQLYIGVAFFSSLNPPDAYPQSSGGSGSYLIGFNGKAHPAVESLGKIISTNTKAQSIFFKGNISKKTPEKLFIKPSNP
jgi:hypothetical protein